MIPSEIEPRPIHLPTLEGGIVIATGNEPRHRRFALRMQQEFGKRIVAWYEWRGPMPQPSLQSWRAKLKHRAKLILGRIPPPVPASICVEEVERLRMHAHLEPIVRDMSEIRSERFLQEMEDLRPLLFLTLGGGLYPRAVLETVHGFAINQHAGWSPDYKGTMTTDHALYHRDLDHIGPTVHITATGADSGPILRRSNPTLVAGERQEQVFERVVILGTELMIEVVHDLLAERPVFAFDQPRTGKTYLAKDYTPLVNDSIWRDTRTDWLGKALRGRQIW